jgi:hypothetical protein
MVKAATIGDAVRVFPAPCISARNRTLCRQWCPAPDFFDSERTLARQSREKLAVALIYRGFYNSTSWLERKRPL